jgi:hypothetical protein
VLASELDTKMAAYTKTEINDLALNQLTDHELDEAVDAFNGFRSIFGRAWVYDYFKGAQIPGFVRSVMEMWGDFRIVNNLPRAEVLVERWRHGIDEQGVNAELRILAQLCRVGFELELYPQVAGRVPDARIRVTPRQPWKYVESSQRGMSKIRSGAELTMQRISERAAHSFPGVHSKIALLRQPEAPELRRILEWLESLPASGSQLEDLAVLSLEPIETATEADDVLHQHVPEPRLFTTQIVAGASAAKATACIGIEDTGAETMLREEAKQLPAAESGILILDISAMIDGIGVWEPLVRRRFQPGIHTRVGAVVLTQWYRGARGRQSESIVLANPHATFPIDSDIIEKLEIAFPRGAPAASLTVS